MEKVNKKTHKNIFYFLLGLILLRPSLDIFSQQEFQIHSSLPYFNLSAVFGVIVFVIGLVFLVNKLKSVIKLPLFYPITIFLGLALISIFYSLDVFVSIREFIRIASIFLLYFLAYFSIQDKKDFYLLLKFILASYILPGLFAIFQLIFNLGLPDEFGGFERIYGTFAHPNLFAFYTLFILGLILSISLVKKAYLPLTAVLVFLLFMTYTRSALAGFFILILVFGIFKYRKILLAGIALFVLTYFFSNIFQERFLELISLDPYGSVVWRLRLWQDILPMSLWQPWFGYGLGTFSKLVEFYRGFSWGSLEAHNDYLKIFIENGILGLATYFWLIIGLLIHLFKIFRKSIGQEKILALGILVISLSLFLASGFDNVLRTTALQWNFWILMAGWLKVKK